LLARGSQLFNFLISCEPFASNLKKLSDLAAWREDAILKTKKHKFIDYQINKKIVLVVFLVFFTLSGGINQTRITLINADVF
jgi:hypothetical protein